MESPEETRNSIEEALHNMSINGEHFDMLMKNQSKMFYKRYTSLVEEGFSECQAFEIVKHRGLT